MKHMEVIQFSYISTELWGLGLTAVLYLHKLQIAKLLEMVHTAYVAPCLLSRMLNSSSQKQVIHSSMEKHMPFVHNIPGLIPSISS